ncbi:MAG TPA: hypothetical protein VHD81_00900 [Mycobacteriales bacterium]|nr:hypothetical protein [Mycobacteriales bacterium]
MPELSSLLAETVAAVQISDDEAVWHELQRELVDLLVDASSAWGPYPADADETRANEIRTFLLDRSAVKAPLV